MSTIRNNTPRVIFNGIKDESIEVLLPELEQEPIHLPLIYTFAQRGPVEPVLCGPNGDFRRIYGTESLNARGPFYTHASKLIEVVTGQANSVLIKRLIPDNAETAGLTLLAKLVKANAGSFLNKLRARSSDGNFINTNGAPMYVTASGAKFDGTGVALVPNGNGNYVGAVDGDWTPTSANNWTSVNNYPADGIYRIQGLTKTTTFSGNDVTIDTIPGINNHHLVEVDTGAVIAVYKPYQTKESSVASDIVNANAYTLSWEWVPASYTNGELDDIHKFIIYTANAPQSGFDLITIPVKTYFADSPGEYGNNIGVREYVVSNYNSDVIEDNKALVIRNQFLERAKVGKPAYVIDTLTNAAGVDFTYNEAAYNETTQENLYINNVVDYYNSDGILAGTSPTFGPCGELMLHEWDANGVSNTFLTGVNVNYISGMGITKNIEILYQLLADAEGAARAQFDAEVLIVEWDTTLGNYVEAHQAIGDFDESTDAMLLNIFTGVSRNTIPYYGFVIGSQGTDSDNTVNESYTVPGVGNVLDHPTVVSFDTLTINYFNGGVDGDLTALVMKDQVAFEVEQNYNNSEYDLTDTGRYPFSCVYDTGYDVDTKIVLMNWMSYRKDVHVAVGTHAIDEKLDIPTEESRATQLLTAASGFAESEEFGTNCVRCVIIAHSSEFIRGIFKRRVPLTFELAHKRARYLGAGNGVVKYGLDYTQIPFNTMEVMNPSKVNNIFMKYENRETLWTSGANFVQFADRSTVFFPALQTVYNPRNSVLTSELIMQLAVDVTKQCDVVWKLLTGNTDLTPGQFLERSNQMLSERVAGKYGSRIVVTPNAYYTEADTARGYSWVMEAIIYGNVMKTTATVNVIVRRNFD